MTRGVGIKRSTSSYWFSSVFYHTIEANYNKRSLQEPTLGGDLGGRAPSQILRGTISPWPTLADLTFSNWKVSGYGVEIAVSL